MRHEAPFFATRAFLRGPGSKNVEDDAVTPYIRGPQRLHQQKDPTF